jgi:hypothetical protein
LPDDSYGGLLHHALHHVIFAAWVLVARRRRDSQHFLYFFKRLFGLYEFAELIAESSALPFLLAVTHQRG